MKIHKVLNLVLHWKSKNYLITPTLSNYVLIIIIYLFTIKILGSLICVVRKMYGLFNIPKGTKVMQLTKFYNWFLTLLKECLKITFFMYSYKLIPNLKPHGLHSTADSQTMGPCKESETVICFSLIYDLSYFNLSLFNHDHISCPLLLVCVFRIESQKKCFSTHSQVIINIGIPVKVMSIWQHTF